MFLLIILQDGVVDYKLCLMIPKEAVNPFIVAVFATTIVILGLFFFFVITVIRLTKILGKHKEIIKRLEELEKK